MEFSIRDKQTTQSILRNQRGQGLIEYILVLVVTVALVLGGIYQLNSAFRAWALNYFGNYLSCLLETGELPVLSGGGGGGGGLCNEIFKPFNIAEGRPLISGWKPGQGGGGGSGGAPGQAPGGGGGSGGGTRENGQAGFAVRSGGGKFASSSGSNSWRGQGQKSSSGSSRRRAAGTYTGSSGTNNYGSLPTTSQQGGKSRQENRLDNRFAFEEEKEERQRRVSLPGMRKPANERQKSAKISVRRSEIKKADGEAADSGLTLPDFLRWLLIAAILLAILVFLGGQALQISKSSE